MLDACLRLPWHVWGVSREYNGRIQVFEGCLVYTAYDLDELQQFAVSYDSPMRAGHGPGGLLQLTLEDVALKTTRCPLEFFLRLY
jgi:hypothetical protein